MQDFTPWVRQLILAAPAAIAVVVGAALLKLLLARGLRWLAEKMRYEPQNLAPISRAGRVLINAGSLVLLLGILGFNLGGIWAMLATVVGMVAIGFVAVWSVLSNALCTLIILVYRPFEVGDELEFAGEPVQGKVVDLNFIYTTLRAADGSCLQVPNNLFLQRVVRRRRGTARVSLATQLGADEPASV
ncbi:MAG TPA: mechanosensitive ion channel domain-containing protein [Polyangiaceae bacterium]|nr:mechanosensitive ion channel domain-containing protein [Polyangiaceae bacterium]